jgi:hypothetical protein
MASLVSRHGPFISLGLACAVVFAAILFVNFRDSGDDQKTDARPLMPAIAADDAVDPADLVAGSPPAHPEEALFGTDSSVSATEQQLVLVSTMPGRKPGEGTARIGTDPRNPQTYARGAQLANGAVIREVHDGYVILEREGRQSLLLVAGADVKLTTRHRDIGKDGSVITVGGEEAVSRPLDKVATSREDLSEIIRAEPYFERDEFAGLKIIPGTNRSRLAQLELEAGDIVRTIEGRQIKSADAAWQVLDDAISSGAAVTIGVQRDGAIISMSLDGSHLAEPMNSFGPHPAMPGS